MDKKLSRYETVSRRAMLKAAAGLGLAAVLPTACGNGDAEVFAGAVTDPGGESASLAPGQPQATTPPLVVPTAVADVEASETPAPTAVPDTGAPETVDPTAVPEATATQVPATEVPVPQFAVVGQMIVSFTYTRSAGGKVERPYVAVWIENAAGELAETVSLWYQQERRGARWLDHLNRWWPIDQDRILAGGIDDSVTISSATREPGSYAVAWDGNIDGVPAVAGEYFVCIESAREEGPNSLIREPFELVGSLSQTALPGTGELSAASVRIDG